MALEFHDHMEGLEVDDLAAPLVELARRGWRVAQLTLAEVYAESDCDDAEEQARFWTEAARRTAQDKPSSPQGTPAAALELLQSSAGGALTALGSLVNPAEWGVVRNAVLAMLAA